MILGIEASHAAKKERTGVEEYCFQIIEHLKGIIPSNVKVVLYSQYQLTEKLKILPSNWKQCVLSWPLKKLWTQIRLSSYFLYSKPDVFFAPGQLIPFFCPKKTVVTVHDSAFMVFKDAYNFGSRKYLAYMNKRIIHNTDTIITPSEFSKAELTRLYNVNPQKIFVTPLGYNEKVYGTKIDSKLENQKILEKFSITKPFILSIGRLENKKNTQGIIDAFNEVRKKHDIQLVLIGKPGVGYDAIKKYILLSPFQADIKQIGFVETKDIPFLLHNCLLFLFPSFYEGFGIPLLEAMACGAPVITSKIKALEEVGGSAVRYADPFRIDSIIKEILFLLENAEQRNYLHEQGLNRVKNFSWQKTAEKTYEVLKKLF